MKTIVLFPPKIVSLTLNYICHFNRKPTPHSTLQFHRCCKTGSMACAASLLVNAFMFSASSTPLVKEEVHANVAYGGWTKCCLEVIFVRCTPRLLMRTVFPAGQLLYCVRDNYVDGDNLSLCNVCFNTVGLIVLCMCSELH